MARRGLRRWFFAVGLVVVAVVVGLLLVLQRAILFPRHMVVVPAGVASSVDGLVHLTVEDDAGGEIEAWLLPGEGASAERPAPLVIFAHGNGEVIDHWPHELAPYRERGISVLLPEYRGYGRSAGEPSEDAIVSDYVRFHDLATARDDVDGSRVVLHGRSLGGGVVCGLAQQRSPAAMILQSTFTSIPDAAPWWAPGFLVRDRFESLPCVQALEVPLLVIHGRRDSVVPIEHGRRLHEAAGDSTLLLYDAGHNDLPHDARYWDAIDALLQRADVRE